MKASQVREMSIPELEKKLRETTEELQNLCVRKQVGKVEKPSEIKKLRRTVARIKTILNEKAVKAS